MGRHDLFPIPLLNGLSAGIRVDSVAIGRLIRRPLAAVSLVQEGKAVAISPKGTDHDRCVETRQAGYRCDCVADGLSGDPRISAVPLTSSSWRDVAEVPPG